jgi:hypothetical protein
MSCLRAMSSWDGSTGLKTDEAKLLFSAAAAVALVGVGFCRHGDFEARGTLAFVIKTGSGRLGEHDAGSVGEGVVRRGTFTGVGSREEEP